MIGKSEGNPLTKKRDEFEIAVNPEDINVPTIYRSTLSKTENKRIFREKNAAVAIGKLENKTHIFGITKGQFSIIDILHHVLNEIGTADLDISTWTSSTSDLRTVHKFLDSGRIRNLRFLVDFSFQRRAPEIITDMRKRFGEGCIRVTRNHAKFYLLRNENWNIVIRTSMNLNFNPRIEDFTLEDNPDLDDFLCTILNEIFQKQSKTATKQNTKWHLNEFRKLI
jgi:hypothetical protein